MKKKILCSISLQEKDANRASLVAALEQVSRSDLIRRLLMDYMNNHPQKMHIDQMLEERLESIDPIISS